MNELQRMLRCNAERLTSTGRTLLGAQARRTNCTSWLISVIEDF